MIKTGKNEYVSFEEYAAWWGCDPCYDSAPRQRGDGYLFYNFNVEGSDVEFLKKFVGAIERTIKGLDKRRKKDRRELEELLDEVNTRIEDYSRYELIVP
jgi:hypothetical protein